MFVFLWVKWNCWWQQRKFGIVVYIFLQIQCIIYKIPERRSFLHDGRKRKRRKLIQWADVCRTTFIENLYHRQNLNSFYPLPLFVLQTYPITLAITQGKEQNCFTFHILPELLCSGVMLSFQQFRRMIKEKIEDLLYELIYTDNIYPLYS